MSTEAPDTTVTMPESQAPAAPAQSKTPGQKLVEKLAAVAPETESQPDAPVQAAPESSPQEAQEPAQPSFLDKAKALGFENLASEEDAFNRVLEYTQQLNARAQQLEAEKQALMALAQKQEPVQAQTAPAEHKPWVPPHIDRNLIAEYREAKLDPTTGKQIVAFKEGTPAEVRQQVERFEQWQKQWAEALTTRPHEVLTEMVKEISSQVAAEKYTEQVQTQEAESFKRKVISDNSEWLFAKDPLSGKPTQQLSAEGQQMYSFCEHAASLGITTPQAQWEYAMTQRELAQLRAKTSQTTVAQTAQQINGQKKQAVQAAALARSAPTPVNNTPAPRTNPRPISPAERLRQKYAEAGMQT